MPGATDMTKPRSESQDKKSKRELAEVESFLSILDVKPSLILEGSDPPDTVITLDGKSIAVEHTAFHTSGTIRVSKDKTVSLRAVESAWEQLSDSISVARQKHDHKLDSINCLLYFRDQKVPPTSKHMQFAEELCRFVKTEEPNLSGSESVFSEFNKGEFPQLASSLRKVSLNKISCYITGHATLMAGSVGLHQHELVSTCEKKLAWDRPEGFDEAWLLIVSNYRTSETMGIVTVEDLEGFMDFNESLSHGPFDKVFIHQPGFGQLLMWEDNCGWSDKGEVVKWL